MRNATALARAHGLAQRLGLATGIATALGAIAVVLTTTGCPASDDADVVRATTTRPLLDGGSYHVTVRASRTLVDEHEGSLRVLVHARETDAGAALTIVPDDPALDPLVTGGTSTWPWSRVDLDSLDGICPAEGDCSIGLTVEVAGAGAATTVQAEAWRRYSSGSFSADATLELVLD